MRLRTLSFRVTRAAAHTRAEPQAGPSEKSLPRAAYARSAMRPAGLIGDESPAAHLENESGRGASQERSPIPAMLQRPRSGRRGRSLPSAVGPGRHQPARRESAAPARAARRRFRVCEWIPPIGRRTAGRHRRGSERVYRPRKTPGPCAGMNWPARRLWAPPSRDRRRSKIRIKMEIQDQDQDAHRGRPAFENNSNRL